MPCLPHTVKNVLRNLRTKAKRSFFMMLEKHLKVHATRAHFYSPIPTLGELPPDIHARINDCTGLDWNRGEQLSALETTFARYAGEYLPPVNPGLSQVDAVVLYAFIREKKPRVMIEIGSGESTKISLCALERNEQEGHAFRFTAVEPYPKPFLRDMGNKSFTLMESKVQDVDARFLSQADILFIDSSHVAKIGSDVNYEMLTVIPELKVGALVHWHDIMLPGDYPKAWIESGTKFWNESYMVHSFMLFNKCFKVLWASRYMQLNHSRELKNRFPYFNPEDPDQQLSSFWIERVG